MSNSASLTFEQLEVTPDLAQDWLTTHNTSNRPLNKLAVERYASDMAAGRWALNGTTIVFDVSGTLVDGQHRLAAVVSAQVTIDALVVRGVPQGSFATIDVGKLRTVSDSLKAAHVVPAGTQGIGAVVSMLGQAVRMILSYQDRKTLVSKAKIGNVEILDYQREHDVDLKRAVNEVLLVMPKGLQLATFAALYHLTTDVDHGSDMFVRFMEDVAKPDNLRATNPAKELRHYLNNLGSGSRKDDLPFKICATWNAYVQGGLAPDLSKSVSTQIKPLPCRAIGYDGDTWARVEPTVSETKPTEEPDTVAPEAPQEPVKPRARGKRKPGGRTEGATVSTADVPESEPTEGMGTMELSEPTVTAADWHNIV